MWKRHSPPCWSWCNGFISNRASQQPHYNWPHMHHLGSTRSVSRRDYLLHTPDAFVRTPLPGLDRGTAIVHVAPQMGAQFAMTTVELAPGGSLGGGLTQRFVYVLDGEVTLHASQSSSPHGLRAGSYSYLLDGNHTLEAAVSVRLLVIEKPFVPLSLNEAEQPQPGLLTGHEEDIAPTPLNGDEDLQVRSLLPGTVAFDFAVNTMTYAPGTALGQVEVHYMEHGLLMLEGSGIYRLGDDWHPVTAGDVIWMAPFCPQWFAAVGKAPAKYIIYKNFNRHVLG